MDVIPPLKVHCLEIRFLLVDLTHTQLWLVVVCCEFGPITDQIMGCQVHSNYVQRNDR